MFGRIPYNIIGGLIGFVLCPLSLLALVGPFAGLFPNFVATALGWLFVVVAALIVPCNIYLSCRRSVVDGSASFFPLCGALAGAGGIAALYGAALWIPAILALGIVDLLGQPILAALVIWVARLDAANSG